MSGIKKMTFVLALSVVASSPPPLIIVCHSNDYDTIQALPLPTCS